MSEERGDTANPPGDALALAASGEGPKVLHAGCAYPGCGVAPSLARFKSEDGRRWCISHGETEEAKQAKQRAAWKGGEATKRQRIRYMPQGTPSPDWSTTKAIRAYIEDRAGRQERGELDGRAVPIELAKLAKGLLDTELLERLDGLEAMIRARLGGGAA